MYAYKTYAVFLKPVVAVVCRYRGGRVLRQTVRLSAAAAALASPVCENKQEMNGVVVVVVFVFANVVLSLFRFCCFCCY